MAVWFDRHGMSPPASNYTGTALGQHSSDWSRDLATSTFDLGGHDVCGWCGLSSSIRILSLKFVSLAIRKIWRTMCVSINRSGDADLWPFALETGEQCSTCHGVPFCQCWWYYNHLFSIYGLLGVGARRPNVSGWDETSSLSIVRLKQQVLLLSGRNWQITGFRHKNSRFRKQFLKIGLSYNVLVQIDMEMAEKYAKCYPTTTTSDMR